MAKRKVTQYTEEFRRTSAKFAYESDETLKQVAEDLGVKEPTLAGWIKTYYPVAKKQKSSLSNNEMQLLQDELKVLRKENIKLKQEREILKKAAAYFANEMQ